MSRLLLLVIVVGTFFSCQKSEAPPPIEKEKLTKILVDIHIAEAAAQPLTLQVKDSMMQVYYDQVCSIHGVSRQDLDESILHLKQHPRQMMELYQDVIDQVEKKSAKKKK